MKNIQEKNTKTKKDLVATATTIGISEKAAETLLKLTLKTFLPDTIQSQHRPYQFESDFQNIFLALCELKLNSKSSSDDKKQYSIIHQFLLPISKKSNKDISYLDILRLINFLLSSKKFLSETLKNRLKGTKELLLQLHNLTDTYYKIYKKPLNLKILENENNIKKNILLYIGEPANFQLSSDIKFDFFRNEIQKYYDDFLNH